MYIGVPGRPIEKISVPNPAGTKTYRVWEGNKRMPDLVIHPKIHTMREDPHNRWKAGRKIEMVYRGAGYKIIDHFNKGIPELETCVSAQKVEIKWMFSLKQALALRPFDIKNSNGPLLMPFVFIDGLEISDENIKLLAVNDGFDSVEDFFRWFKKDWIGKIIHWTDFRY